MRSWVLFQAAADAGLGHDEELPAKEIGALATAEGIQASADGAAVCKYNQERRQFTTRVALSGAYTEWQKRVEAFSNAAGTDAVVAPTLTRALQLAAGSTSKKLIVVDGVVSPAEIEAIATDEAVAASISDLTFSRSLRSQQVLVPLLLAINRDGEAYRQHVKREEAKQAARDRKAQRAAERSQRRRGRAGRSGRGARMDEEEEEENGEPQNEEEEADEALLNEEDPPAADIPKKPLAVPALRRLTFTEAAVAVAQSETVVPELSTLIENSKTLKEVVLSDCGLTGATATQLLSALFANQSVEAVDLSRNGFGHDEEPPTEALSKYIQEGKYVQDLRLDDNDLSPGMVAALAEALATSDTRVATPEPEAEPEFEPHQDELEELADEPPTKPGYPEDPATAAADADMEEAAGDADDEGDGHAAAGGSRRRSSAKGKTSDGDGEGEDTAEEDEEEADDDDEAAESGKPNDQGQTVADEDGDAAGSDGGANSDQAGEEDEEDEEEREARRQEERAEAEAAWREREEQYMWGPQRACLEYDEVLARREVLKAHIDATAALKVEQFADRGQTRGRQLQREREDRERRSGWSHLRALSLAGNTIGSEGAAALAKALRHKVPNPAFTATEAAEGDQAADEEAEEGVDEEEEAARDENEAPPAAEGQEEEGGTAGGDDDEEAGGGGEGWTTTTDQKDTDDTNAADGTDPATNDEDGGMTTTTKRGKKAKPAPPPELIATGLALAVLDLSRGGVAAKGAVPLFDTIADNCPSLTRLLLRRNKFAARHKTVPIDPSSTGPAPGQEEEEGGEEDLEGEGEGQRRTRRVLDETYVSPAVHALSRCVAANTTLLEIDVGFNGICGPAAAVLAGGLAANSTLTTLDLSGNPLAEGANGGLSAVLGSLEGLLATLKTLRLASVGLGAWLEKTPEAEVVAKAHHVFQVPDVDLSSNGIGASQARMDAFTAAAEASATLTTRRLLLGNNGFVDPGAALVDMLKPFARRLQELDLSGAPRIGDSSLVTLIQFLTASCASMQHLNLARTHGGNAVISEMAIAIQHSMFYHTVDVGACACDKGAAAKLAEAVARSATLQRLVFWSCTEEIAPVVLQAVLDRRPPGLQFLDVGVHLPKGKEPDPGSPELAYAIEDVEEIMAVARRSRTPL